MKKYLIRKIGTEDYFGEYAPVGTTKEKATRLFEDEAEGFVERSKERNGEPKVEIVEVERLGFCKECGTEIFDDYEVSGYEGVYECPVCNYPSCLADLWDEKPDYISE